MVSWWLSTDRIASHQLTIGSDSGVIGDPRHATAELGQQLWDASVTWAADYLNAAAFAGD